MTVGACRSRCLGATGVAGLIEESRAEPPAWELRSWTSVTPFISVSPVSLNRQGLPSSLFIASKERRQTFMNYLPSVRSHALCNRCIVRKSKWMPYGQLLAHSWAHGRCLAAPAVIWRWDQRGPWWEPLPTSAVPEAPTSLPQGSLAPAPALQCCGQQRPHCCPPDKAQTRLDFFRRCFIGIKESELEWPDEKSVVCL